MKPEELSFTKSHEWMKINGDVAIVGITDYAQKSLGDVVFVDMPGVGNSVEHGDAIATIESVKAVSDIYAPTSGEIIKINEEISSTPELVNKDPYGKGWLFEIRVAHAHPGMSYAEYNSYLESINH